MHTALIYINVVLPVKAPHVYTYIKKLVDVEVGSHPCHHLVSWSWALPLCSVLVVRSILLLGQQSIINHSTQALPTSIGHATQATKYVQEYFASIFLAVLIPGPRYILE